MSANQAEAANGPATGRRRRPVWRALVLRRLQALAAAPGACLCVNDAWGEVRVGQPTPDAETVRVEVLRPVFYRRLALGGSLGAAESYMDGDWRCNDLGALIRLFVPKLNAADAVADVTEGVLSTLASGIAWLRDRALRNSKAGSRRNIHAHYDLGNEFFALFLDETLSYSCGIFADHGEEKAVSMAEASIAKLERICQKLSLSAEHRVIEIGSGWGSFAVHAASRHGCQVTTTTISEAQHAFVKRLVAERGLEEQVTVLLKDYRDLEGRFDKLVSIEMIEAVGHERLPRYFRACGELLHDHGEALIQAITMPERRYPRYLRQSDFIRRHVFPGSCVPSLAAILTAASEAAGFRLSHLEELGPHYAETLCRWRGAFEARLDAVRTLGFDERFIRLWRFYLSYCEAGFDERYIGDVQILLRKPGCRKAPLHGALS